MKDLFLSKQRPTEFVVDGTDGAGKTSCVRFLSRKFQSLGFSVSTGAPYREQEVFELWESDPVMAAKTIVQVINRLREDRKTSDVIIWDRGWPTAYISTSHMQARTCFQPLCRSILLLGTIQRTREKAANHPAGVWVTDDALVTKYNAAYHELAKTNASDLMCFRPSVSGVFDFEEVWQQLSRSGTFRC